MGEARPNRERFTPRVLAPGAGPAPVSASLANPIPKGPKPEAPSSRTPSLATPNPESRPPKGD